MTVEAALTPEETGVDELSQQGRPLSCLLY